MWPGLCIKRIVSIGRPLTVPLGVTEESLRQYIIFLCSNKDTGSILSVF